MKAALLFALSATLVATTASAQPRPPTASPPDELTRALVAAGLFGPAVSDARTVALARAYGGYHYGIAGRATAPVAAMKRLLRMRPPALARGLEVVAQRGTPAGRVFALGALFGLDRDAMLRAVPAARGSTERVLILDEGCVQLGRRVALSSLVESHVVSGAIWRQLHGGA